MDIRNYVGTTQNFVYQIRWYEKDQGIFPKILQVFRLSCGQPLVNFPLTFKVDLRKLY